MVDITHKITTLREATAIATLRTSSEETIKAIRENKVPKGMFLKWLRLPDFLE